MNDLVFTGNDPCIFKEFKNSIIQQFEKIDIGLMFYYIAIVVRQCKDGIFLSLRKIMLKLFSRSLITRTAMLYAHLLIVELNCSNIILQARLMQSISKVWLGDFTT